jgi:hypothetical protein
MPDPTPALEAPCAVCGALTDLRALWRCPCGAYLLCYRSSCHLRIPAAHRDGSCAPRMIHPTNYSERR